jgi:hypothetical protein
MPHLVAVAKGCLSCSPSSFPQSRIFPFRGSPSPVGGRRGQGVGALRRLLTVASSRPLILHTSLLLFFYRPYGANEDTGRGRIRANCHVRYGAGKGRQTHSTISRAGRRTHASKNTRLDFRRRKRTSPRIARGLQVVTLARQWRGDLPFKIAQGRQKPAPGSCPRAYLRGEISHVLWTTIADKLDKADNRPGPWSRSPLPHYSGTRARRGAPNLSNVRATFPREPLCEAKRRVGGEQVAFRPTGPVPAW